eukprot:TRINITY_DN6332_c0_g5_i1.p1 TRINITY_DN6332_c0_g5~~TRINITY_DN6332_c0_g5_i1.p1  ORF type:complete len:573 (+),score=179.99 TRINITY_DN6332_c0_g5_i1:55-1719(+)
MERECELTGLPYVTPTPALDAELGDLGKVRSELLYVAVVEKVNRRRAKQKRVLLLTRERLLLCDQSQKGRPRLTRFLRTSRIACVRRRRLPAGQWEVLLSVPQEYDILLVFCADKRNKTDETATPEHFIRVLRAIRESSGRASPLSPLSAASGLPPVSPTLSASSCGGSPVDSLAEDFETVLSPQTPLFRSARFSKPSGYVDPQRQLTLSSRQASVRSQSTRGFSFRSFTLPSPLGRSRRSAGSTPPPSPPPLPKGGAAAGAGGKGVVPPTDWKVTPPTPPPPPPRAEQPAVAPLRGSPPPPSAAAQAAAQAAADAEAALLPTQAPLPVCAKPPDRSAPPSPPKPSGRRQVPPPPPPDSNGLLQRAREWERLIEAENAALGHRLSELQKSLQGAEAAAGAEARRADDLRAALELERERRLAAEAECQRLAAQVQAVAAAEAEAEAHVRAAHSDACSDARMHHGGNRRTVPQSVVAVAAAAARRRSESRHDAGCGAADPGPRCDASDTDDGLLDQLLRSQPIVSTTPAPSLPPATRCGFAAPRSMISPTRRYHAR